MREVCAARDDRKGMQAGKRQGAEAPAREAQEALRGRPALQGAGFFAPGRKSSRLKPLTQEPGGDCAGRGYAPDDAHSEHAGRVQSQDHAGATGQAADGAADPAVDEYEQPPEGSGGGGTPGLPRMAPAKR